MAEVHETLAARAAARVGRVVCDKWRLDRVLGVGGVAAVYAACHRNGRRVAVKILHPEMAVDASIRRRFLREGYVANRVEHPGAVVVLDDAVDDDGSVLLVMELLEGETLETRCRRNSGRVPPLEALVIADGVLSVLEAAHAKGILHRDVTPSNVFVTADGQVKLLDFGIARLRDPEGGERTMSVPGALGTPAFMSPEQARGLWDELDARSDLWAVGAVLYRVLTGRSVHTGRTSSEQLLAAMTRRAKPLATVAPELPGSLSRVVDRALRPEPNKRWEDASSFRAAIDEAYAQIAGQPLAKAERLVVSPSEEPLDTVRASTTPTHQDGFGTTIGESAHRSRRLRLAAAIALAAVAGMAALVFVRPGATRVQSSRELVPLVGPRAQAAAPPVPTQAAPAPSAPATHTPAPLAQKTAPAKRASASVARPTPAPRNLEATDPLFDRKD